MRLRTCIGRSTLTRRTDHYVDRDGFDRVYEGAPIAIPVKGLEVGDSFELAGSAGAA